MIVQDDVSKPVKHIIHIHVDYNTSPVGNRKCEKLEDVIKRLSEGVI